MEELTPEEISERELCYKEEISDSESRIGDFFRKIFGLKKDEDQPKVAGDQDKEDATGEEDRVGGGGDYDDDDNDGDDDDDDVMGGNPFVKNGKLYGQDYEKIKARCLHNGTLFTDKRFPATNSSLFYTSPAPRFEWRRPHQLCESPQLIVDGVDRFDINQGELGDCWLLAAMSCLAMDQSLFSQVMSTNQSFTTNYCGIFLFRFWQYGEWVEVVVDDSLPVIEGKLAFIHSDSRNEFWAALMEKAYAKLNGSYENLKGGTTCEAMVDFTGGCSEIFDLAKPPLNLFNIMQECQERKSLNCCSILPDPDILEARTPDGLVKGHAYTVSKVVKAEIETSRVKGVIPLVRIRNPWGNETEWKGTWRDNGREWNLIPAAEKESMGLVFEHDGEFWMSFKDFSTHFNQLEVCNLSPESIVDWGDENEEGAGEVPQWCVQTHTGAWVAGQSAGGCRNYLESFVSNPQFCVRLEDPDSGDGEELCTLVVSLMQKGRRQLRDEGLGMLTIGFVVYRLKSSVESETILGEDFFKYNLSVARSKSFVNLREVTERFRLPPADYLVVPSTFDPGCEGEFLLRTFCAKPALSRQLTIE